MSDHERRVFFSWQSDTPNRENRTLLGDALERACKALRVILAPSDRPVVQTASSDIVGARSIADVLFERIRVADAFVADVSTVMTSGSRLSPNPNVLLETGYALHALGDTRVTLVANLAHGRIEDLPFDIRSRLVATYTMTPGDAPAPMRDKLTEEFTQILERTLSLPRQNEDVRIDVSAGDVFFPGTQAYGDSIVQLTFRNFSEHPLRIVSWSFEDEAGAGKMPIEQQAAIGTIPAKDSRVLRASFDGVAKLGVTRVVATDGLGRRFVSAPGALATALARKAMTVRE